MDAVTLYWNCVALVVALALARGGPPEQLAGAILIMGSALGFAAANSVNSFREVEWDIFAVDILSFAGFVALALRANRYWPSCLAGLKLAPIAGHIAKALDPVGIGVRAYGSLTAALAYPAMAVLLVAVLRHRLRARRYGGDPPWR